MCVRWFEREKLKSERVRFVKEFSIVKTNRKKAYRTKKPRILRLPFDLYVLQLLLQRTSIVYFLQLYCNCFALSHVFNICQV